MKKKTNEPTKMDDEKATPSRIFTITFLIGLVIGVIIGVNIGSQVEAQLQTKDKQKACDEIQNSCERQRCVAYSHPPRSDKFNEEFIQYIACIDKQHNKIQRGNQ